MKIKLIILFLGLILSLSASAQKGHGSHWGGRGSYNHCYRGGYSGGYYGGYATTYYVGPTFCLWPWFIFPHRRWIEGYWYTDSYGHYYWVSGYWKLRP